MSTDALDPSALISLLPTLLPESSKRLASPHDGITSLIHAAMTVLAFRLIAVDDSAAAASYTSNVLPAEWNKNGPSHYTLRYRHDQSSLEFLLKIAKLGPRTLINAIAVESDKATSLDISTLDFVSQSFYPHDLSQSDAQPLVHGYISSNRIADFISQFKLKIIQKLIPGLRKDGYAEDVAEGSRNTGDSRPTQAQPSSSQPQIPRYDPNEEFPYRTPSHIPSRNPLEIGRRDLDPIPMNPFSPPSLFPSNGGDGMLVGPDHPIFDSRRGRGNFGDVGGPWGGDGFLPPMGAPPGARFDPVGPFTGGPFTGPGRTLGPNRGRNPLGGDPDNDEFMPPGAGNMFM